MESWVEARTEARAAVRRVHAPWDIGSQLDVAAPLYRRPWQPSVTITTGSYFVYRFARRSYPRPN